MTDNEQELVNALGRALLTIDAIYQWVDKVEAAGGTTCISGVASAHAMLASLKKNRGRTETLILEPARAVLEKLA